MKLALELNKESKDKIEDLVPKISKLSENFSRFTVVDKNKNDSNLPAVKFLDKKFPDKNIMPHYSIQNHYDRDISVVADNFFHYIEKIRETEIENLLLISGPKDRKNTSVELLDYLPKSDRSFENLKLAIAFNPYKRENLREEKLKLKSKLKHDFVTAVYFQIGIEQEKFKDGVDFVRNIRSDIKLKSCLMVPDRTFLSRFKAMPWKGVNLSEKYLNDLDFAKNKTREMFELMKDKDVIPLIECNPIDDKFNKKVISFL